MMEGEVAMEREPERVAEYGTALFMRHQDGELAPAVREMFEKHAQRRTY